MSVRAAPEGGPPAARDDALHACGEGAAVSVRACGEDAAAPPAVRFAVPLEQGDVVALAFLAVRPNPLLGDQPQERVRLQQAADRLFVFAAVKRAGRISEPPAGSEHRHRVLQNIPLPRRALLHRLRGPFGHGLRVLAEHAFARAGGVQHDPVEGQREARGQLPGCGLRHHGVPDAKPLHIFRQNAGALRMDFVADEQALSGHYGGDLRRFAAGSRGQIQYRFARLGIEQLHGRHRRRLLNIV
ncbi:hypothetical protein DJ90_2106 [Paenibacillus macerans]|uniref:Uncharacterized protein n=1 Tax=Paenibacillus macerans TaxID=44252 RepID=A0A090ZNZ4_PAEMA|nr:hypothetical protein DJ90_2106 [Paenibacillus macerans]